MTSVMDPDVFGPPGSVIILYASGSFHQQAKIVRKTLISTILLLLLTFFQWKRTDVNAPSKRNKHIKKMFAACQPLSKSRIRIRIKMSDPQH